VNGVLPTGVTFSTQTGFLSGTPEPGTSGDYPLIVTASNEVPPDAVQNFILTVHALGNAGLVALQKTGQTGCWDAVGIAITCSGTGQDGDLQKGVAWPNPRYIDNNDQTITDKLTGLIWAKDANLINTRDPSFDMDNLDSSLGDGKVTWQHALDYIKKLNSENFLGFNDWRLPNAVELNSLTDSRKLNAQSLFVASWLSGQGFIDIQKDYYWTSTSEGNLGNPLMFFSAAVDFWYGRLDSSVKTNGLYVWPVRAGQSGSSGSLSLPRTGQTGCWDYKGNAILCAATGQDGELQVGEAWPDPRFTVNSDQTVTDKMTGLIWPRDAHDFGPAACDPAETRSWQEALNYVKCLNMVGYLGKSDWRLPNIYELRSVMNFLPNSYSRASNQLNNEGFANVLPWQYWSSTSAVTGTGNIASAWTVENGYENTASKLFGLYVWPVR